MITTVCRVPWFVLFSILAFVSGRAVHAAEVRAIGAGTGVGDRTEAVVAVVLPRKGLEVDLAFREVLSKRMPAVRFVDSPYPKPPKEVPLWLEGMRRQRPDLIYVWGNAATAALLGARPGRSPASPLASVPVVFVEVADPVGAGIVASLARPGGNATGVVHLAPLAVQWRAINAYRPVRRLGFFNDPDDATAIQVRAEFRDVLASSGAELVEVTLPRTAAGRVDATRLRAAMRQLATLGVDFLYLLPLTSPEGQSSAVLSHLALAERIHTFCHGESGVRLDG